MEKKSVLESSASMALRKTARRRRIAARDLATLLLARHAARRISVDGHDSVAWDEV